MQYWLMKTEPNVFSIDDLKIKRKSGWDGVRNYQARNFMRDQMKKGDIVLIYHSSCEVPGIAGLGTVSKEAYPDPTQYDSKSPYFDPKSTIDNPRWFMVEVEFKSKLQKLISLAELKNDPGLSSMIVLKKGSRLSITPITNLEYFALENKFS